MVDSDLDMYLDRTADRVANVTLESDSLPETPDTQRVKYKRRRKMVKKQRNQGHAGSGQYHRPAEDTTGVMDVDTQDDQDLPSGSNMEWEKDIALESELSEDSDCTEYSDADDEQSDDEPDGMTKRPETTFERRTGTSLCSLSTFGGATPRTIMRRLERFVRDETQHEIEIPCLSKPHELRRLIQHLGLEKSNRHRGTIILRKVK
ncbi:hypothetical protein L596_005270 [Steinernema carpocapsae]|uniref:Uncharacterized protein n=1 Tax=Steinernema carpocapsae TaxID=34508 RepID=A0A4U8UZY1_STECR|nr:hypothetical protein L596_005270 [Steinernema carpocapsae]